MIFSLPFLLYTRQSLIEEFQDFGSFGKILGDRKVKAHRHRCLNISLLIWLTSFKYLVLFLDLLWFHVLVSRANSLSVEMREIQIEVLIKS